MRRSLSVDMKIDMLRRNLRGKSSGCNPSMMGGSD
jgi:hypothetical protein